LTASFGYDALGRRKSKTVNSVTTGYWYDGRDVLAELNGSTPTATYIRNLSIDEPFIRKGPTDEFYQTDVLGSTLALTDAAGSSQTTYTYEPFGKTTVSGTSTNSFKYTGRENDTDGLYYYRARYYGSGGGRFLQEDPIGISGGLNLYNYVNSNPVNAIDPTGQIAWALPAIPVIAIPAFEALTALGGLAIGAIMSTVGDTPRDQAADDARDREHQAYKDRCGETPPSGLKDECEVWRWKLQRERDCVRMMEEWDRKWRPDLKKNNAIEQRKRGIQRLEKLIETRCGCPKGD
jgi:RHS repeat-associated protein